MNAALIEAFGQPPRYAPFNDPVATDGAQLIRVRAAALSNLVKGQAAGSHYSSASQLPFVPGFDGVGTLPDGSRVYFFGPPVPFGAMAELSLGALLLVRPRRRIVLPLALGIHIFGALMTNVWFFGPSLIAQIAFLTAPRASARAARVPS